MKIRLKKGIDLPIEGGVADLKPVPLAMPSVCAVCPDDFAGFTPKAIVKEGDTISVGAPLMLQKNQMQVALVSPVAGTVKAVVRGERRKIERIEISVGNIDDYIAFEIPSDAQGLRELLARSGMLAMMRKRPYDIVPDAFEEVRDIFVTAITSAPLEPSMQAFLPDDARKCLETAAKALAKITKGKVYFSRRPDFPFANLKGTEDVVVEGPHPSGNVGVQIANIKPVNKGENVWTLDAVLLYKIGLLLTTGKVDPSVKVAVVGPEVKKPLIVETVAGAPVADIVKGKLADTPCHKRIISGNVLTGRAVGDGSDAFLRAPYRMVSVIAEGDDVDEFMGWASVAPGKLSAGRTFPFAFLTKLFRPDARINGGRRAMIMSGEYENTIPMDILPEYLLKAIMAKDIDRMEQLGIYEVAPEDFALAEFADTSKLPLQKIVREGLDWLRKEV